MTILLVTLYIFAAISIWLGLLSLRGGIRFIRYLQTELTKDYPEFTPLVTVFMPLRGIDQGLRENINAIFAQDYPAYEIVFVADRADEPALAVVEDARHSFAGVVGPVMQFVIAGPAVDQGQKVHNLIFAVDHAHPQSEVFAFVDSDARPKPEWLRALVAPLNDESIGATTGYRWFVPVRNGIASHLQSVWNAAIASALGANSQKNFCWGGSTAIRRTTFESCKVSENWRGAVSDDFAMTRALHKAVVPIKFVPQCLTPSFEDCTVPQLFEFTTRQIKITRAYAAHLWKSVFIGSAIFVLTFFGGMALVIVRAAMHSSFATPLFLLLIIFALGAMKSHLRLRAVTAIINDHSCYPLASGLGALSLQRGGRGSFSPDHLEGNYLSIEIAR
jgi:ceramide glucosyltransferase